jgi:hypothetical protein
MTIVPVIASRSGQVRPGRGGRGPVSVMRRRIYNGP